MTLNELIKLADVNQAQPMQPQQPQQPQPPKPTAAAQPFNAQQGQPAPQRNGYGYSRDTYKIPQQYAQHQNADGSLTRFNQQEYNDWQNNVKNWEAQRKADLEAQGIQLTDQNKHLWNHAAAWNYINQQRNAAQDTGRAWWKPWTWFQDAPEQFRQATNNWDPVEMEAAKAQSQGYQTGTQQDIMLNRAEHAKVADHYINSLANKFVLGDYKNQANKEFANSLVDIGVDPHDAIDTVFKSNAEVMFQDNTPGNENSWRNILLREGVGLGEAFYGADAPQTYLLMKGIGKIPFVGKHPVAATVALGAGLPFGSRMTQAYMTNKNPQAGLLLGMNSNREYENLYRDWYGDDAANATFQIGMLQNQNGEFTNAWDVEHGGDNPANYAEYTSWAAGKGFSGDQLQDPAVMKQWVQRSIDQGTPVAAIMETPMFQNLTPTDKAQFAVDMLKNRVLGDTGMFKLLKQKYWDDMSEAEMLADAMRNDKSGVIADTIGEFFAMNDTATVLKFIEMNAGDGTGGSVADTSNLFKTFQDGMVQNLKNNPDQTGAMMQGLLNLQAAKSEAGGAALANDSQGVAAIKKAFTQALADPDFVNEMSDDKLLELAELFANNGSAAGGMDMLGDEWVELANTAEANIRNRVSEAFFNNPFKNGPQIAGLWLASKGFGGMGKFASNPWIFYSVAMSLLLGGALMLTSGIDDDEEDDYHRALKDNPWS